MGTHRGAWNIVIVIMLTTNIHDSANADFSQMSKVFTWSITVNGSRKMYQCQIFALNTIDLGITLRL